MPRKPKASASAPTVPPVNPVNTVNSAAPELADLAHWFGTDRWAALEKQAAITRAWDGNTFRNRAAEFLAAAVKALPREAAIYHAAVSLLRALGSAPSDADRARRPVN